ncbi:MAG: AMP-binding protein, partial [Dehalococcoidia bacterium]
MRYETMLTRAYADQCRAAGAWPDRLLNDDFAAAVSRHPRRTALVDARGRLTYAQLQAQADLCALGLLVRGVRRGDVVTVQLPNWSEFVVLTLALERIGAVINPIAPIFRQRELRVMLRLAGSVAAVIPARFRDWEYPAMYAELRQELPALRQLIVIDGITAAKDGVLSWTQLLETGATQQVNRAALDWLRPSPDDVTELIFTSGTTGEPKGVLHTSNTVTAMLDALIRTQGLSGEDVIHMASTFGHQTGYLAGVRLPLHLGAQAVYQDTWDAATFVRLIESERITFTMGATPFLSDTLRAPNLPDHDIGSLRLFCCGGAPIPQPLAEAAARQLPCRLMPAWGMTENGIVTSVLPDDPAERVTTTDGQPLPGMEVRICAANGSILPPGEEGDLEARGPFTFAGYLQGRSFTEQFVKPEGWFKTGDRARQDAEGFIRISGRTKDIIIRGGENVPVKEIEDTLLQHPKVRTVALVGLADARLGEIGCACIIPEDGEILSIEDLRLFLREAQVTPQFWPERLALMSAFPMTPSGKVQKF